MKATFPWLFIAPFGGPVVPDVYVRTAVSPGSKVTGGGVASRNRASRPARSTVSSDAIRSAPGNARGSSRVWYSSSEVVSTVCTLVRPTTPAATSR